MCNSSSLSKTGTGKKMWPFTTYYRQLDKNRPLHGKSTYSSSYFMQTKLNGQMNLSHFVWTCQKSEPSSEHFKTSWCESPMMPRVTIHDKMSHNTENVALDQLFIHENSASSHQNRKNNSYRPTEPHQHSTTSIRSNISCMLTTWHQHSCNRPSPWTTEDWTRQKKKCEPFTIQLQTTWNESWMQTFITIG